MLSGSPARQCLSLEARRPAKSGPSQTTELIDTRIAAPPFTFVFSRSIALGHPLGVSGARLALTLACELRERGGTDGLASLCIGAGQGIAAIIECVS